MSDIVATVTYDDTFSTSIASTSDTTVTAVGIQGLSATDVSLSNMSDVDTSSLNDGSVLVYKTQTSRWTSTLLLNQQQMEGGEY